MTTVLPARHRRTHPIEFKIELVAMCRQHGISVSAVALAHGVNANQTSVYPREVVKRALFHNAAAVIFAHNHPSGACEPSQSDRLLTDALKQSLALVDVRALDHFIIAGTDCLSFAERGLI